MKKVMFVGIGALTLLFACKKDNHENDVNSTDQLFVTQVSLGNNAEVMAGQLAATKGTDPSVVAFGQMMVTEHTQAQTDLKSIGSSINMNVTDSVDAEHEALMNRLSSLNGYSFDTAYINSQIKDHQRMIGFFQAEIYYGNNINVRNYAYAYLPHIQYHLIKADSIKRHALNY